MMKASILPAPSSVFLEMSCWERRARLDKPLPCWVMTRRRRARRACSTYWTASAAAGPSGGGFTFRPSSSFITMQSQFGVGGRWGVTD
jgi:hypothetical protein